MLRGRLAHQSPAGVIHPEFAETVRKHFPHLKIFARVVGRVHAYEFQKRGIQSFYIETHGSSLNLGVDVLRELLYVTGN